MVEITTVATSGDEHRRGASPSAASFVASVALTDIGRKRAGNSLMAYCLGGKGAL